MTVRVGLVDDQAMMRTGFRTILEAQPDIAVAWEAGTGVDALARAAEDPPEVVLMDVRMPEMDGLEATRRLREREVATKVLVLTTFDLDEYVYGALRAGASGFMIKNATPEELVRSVRVIADGEALLAPSVTRRLIDRFASGRTPLPDARLDSLTDREREVLTLVSKGLTNAKIAAELYVGEATVKTHLSRVLMKLGVRDRVQAVIYAYETGFAGRD